MVLKDHRLAGHARGFFQQHARIIGVVHTSTKLTTSKLLSGCGIVWPSKISTGIWEVGRAMMSMPRTSCPGACGRDELRDLSVARAHIENIAAGLDERAQRLAQNATRGD
jgi:hypothetical protein